jgi:hypothetical protein
MIVDVKDTEADASVSEIAADGKMLVERLGVRGRWACGLAGRRSLRGCVG